MYTVIEIQNGVVGNNVWAFPTENDAWAKFYAVLSVAATSAVAVHAAVILRQDGLQIAAQCFSHGVVSE